jgi:hypothetical protein
MMSDSVAWLAAAGGTALVSAAATDAWQTARSGFAKLLGRGDSSRELSVATRLDALAAELAQQPAHEQEQVRQTLIIGWTARLHDFLEDTPEVAEELRRLVDRVRTALPEDHSAARQTVHAQDQAIQYVSQHGNVYVHHHRP